MVEYYTIFGRKVGSHILAMATLGTAFTAGYFGLRGGKKQDKAKGPPINAGSKDEEKFINDFIMKQEASKKH